MGKKSHSKGDGEARDDKNTPKKPKIKKIIIAESAVLTDADLAIIDGTADKRVIEERLKTTNHPSVFAFAQEFVCWKRWFNPETKKYVYEAYFKRPVTHKNGKTGVKNSKIPKSMLPLFFGNIKPSGMDPENIKMIKNKYGVEVPVCDPQYLSLSEKKPRKSVKKDDAPNPKSKEAMSKIAKTTIKVSDNHCVIKERPKGKSVCYSAFVFGVQKLGNSLGVLENNALFDGLPKMAGVSVENEEEEEKEEEDKEKKEEEREEPLDHGTDAVPVEAAKEEKAPKRHKKRKSPDSPTSHKKERKSSKRARKEPQHSLSEIALVCTTPFTFSANVGPVWRSFHQLRVNLLKLGVKTDDPFEGVKTKAEAMAVIKKAGQDKLGLLISMMHELFVFSTETGRTAESWESAPSDVSFNGDTATTTLIFGTHDYVSKNVRNFKAFPDAGKHPEDFHGSSGDAEWCLAVFNRVFPFNGKPSKKQTQWAWAAKIFADRTKTS